MLYGIAAAAAETNMGGTMVQWSPNNAVTFNDCRLVLSSIVCTDNADFSLAGWFNADWDYSGNYTVVLQVNPEGSYTTYFKGNADASATFSVSTNYTGGIIATPPLASGSWQHIMWTVQTSPSRIVKCRINDVDITGDSLSIFGPTFTPILSNGLPMWIGSDDAGGDFYGGSMMDVSIWPGVSFLTAGDISEITRRLFIDAGGAPVDPATAIASLGAPAVMLSGAAGTFHLNTLGTSGALTIAEGSLTNAATHP